MTKKILSSFLFVLILLLLCGCTKPDVTTSNISVQQNEDTRTVFMEDYDVSFDLPKGWQVDMKDAAVDMFCTNGKLHMGIYGYFAEDYADDANYIEIWEKQNQSVLQDFNNVLKLEHTPDFMSTDKILKTEIYSSEIDDVKQYSYFVFVQDKKKPDVFLWVFFSGQPSKVRDNFDQLEGIVDTIKFN